MLFNVNGTHVRGPITRSNEVHDNGAQRAVDEVRVRDLAQGVLSNLASEEEERFFWNQVHNKSELAAADPEACGVAKSVLEDPVVVELLGKCGIAEVTIPDTLAS